VIRDCLVSGAEKWLTSKGVPAAPFRLVPVDSDSFNVDCAPGLTSACRDSLEIYIRTDLGDGDTFLTLVHELRHRSDAYHFPRRFSIDQHETRAYSIEARARAEVVIPALAPVSAIVSDLFYARQDALVRFARGADYAQYTASEIAAVLIELLGLAPAQREARLARLKASGRRYLGLA
jgi:hypothetical protein